MFKAASLASELFLEKDCINPTWKKDLESYPTEKTK